MEIRHFRDKVYDDEEFYIKEKLSNGQTLRFGFQLHSYSEDTDYWNIYLGIYSKRKHIGRNESEKRITGMGNPFEALALIKEALPKIEEEILLWSNQPRNVFFCHWIDNRRRDVYEKFLKRYGYSFSTFENRKVLLKIVNQE